MCSMPSSSNISLSCRLPCVHADSISEEMNRGCCLNQQQSGHPYVVFMRMAFCAASFSSVVLACAHTSITARGSTKRRMCACVAKKSRARSGRKSRARSGRAARRTRALLTRVTPTCTCTRVHVTCRNSHRIAIQTALRVCHTGIPVLKEFNVCTRVLYGTVSTCLLYS